MAITFPSSPSLNDTYTVNGRTYVWNGTTWRTIKAPVPDVLPTLSVDNNFSAGGTLHVDSVNNEIGIGTAAPSHQLHLTQDLGVDGNLIVGGTITVPTPTAGTNDTKVATTEFVQTAVSGLVDAAPETLNTLNELAAALGDDANFATTVTNSLAGKSDTGHVHSYLPLSGGTVTGQTTFSGVDGVKLTGPSGGVWWDDRNGDGTKWVMYHSGDMIGLWNGSTTPFQFKENGVGYATNWSVGTGSSPNAFVGGSNYWRPQDAYGNSYFDINSGQFYVDSDTYYFRNRASTNSLVIDSAGNGTFTGRVYSNSLQLNSGPLLSDAGPENDLRLTTAYGYLDFGPLNTSWCHFQTDRPGFYFYKKIDMGGGSNVRGTLSVSTGVDAGYFSKSISGAYAQIQSWPNDGNWLGLMGGNGYILIDGSYSDDDIYVRTYNNSGRVNIGAGHSNTLQVDNGAATMNGTLYIQNLLYTSQSNTTGVFMSLADDGWFRDDQNAQIYFRNYANNNWGTMVGIFSNQSTLTSKKDIAPLNKVDRQALLQDMVDMPLYSYKYIGDDDDTPTIYGPIIELAPNYLSRTGTDLWLAPYVGALHATIKELNSKIEELEQRIVSVGG